LTDFSTVVSQETDSKSRLTRVPSRLASISDFTKPGKSTRDKEPTVTPSVLFDPFTDIPPSTYAPTLVEWCWNDNKGGFTPYDTQTTFILEKEYQKDKYAAVKLTHGFYGATPSGFIVDFGTMKQIKVETAFERKVQRRMNWMKVDKHKKKVFDLEEKIRKLEQQLAANPSGKKK